VLAHDPLGDGEAETGAALLGGEVGLEHPWQILRGDAGPVSDTWRSTSPPSRRAATRKVPLARIASSPLRTRFSSTCRIWSASTRTAGSPGSTSRSTRTPAGGDA
jgi:hypothetical protein